MWVRVPPESSFAAGAQRSLSWFRGCTGPGGAAAPGRCRRAEPGCPPETAGLRRGAPLSELGQAWLLGTGGQTHGERSARTQPSQGLIKMHHFICSSAAISRPSVVIVIAAPNQVWQWWWSCHLSTPNMHTPPPPKKSILTWLVSDVPKSPHVFHPGCLPSCRLNKRWLSQTGAAVAIK